MVTLSPQCCWLLGLGQISGVPPRSIKKPRKMSRCDPGLAKKDSHPIHRASGSQPSRNFGAHPPSRCLVALAVVSLFLLSSLLVSEFHGLYMVVPPCRTASAGLSVSLSLSLSLSSLGCSLCLYLSGFGVSWRSGHVSGFAGKLACCCSYMRLLLLPHHDYDYDDYNNCYLLLLLLLFLLLLLMILDPTSNYDDLDADSTKQLKVTLFASLQWWCWWRWWGPQWKSPNYPRTNFGTTDDEWSLNE